VHFSLFHDHEYADSKAIEEERKRGREEERKRGREEERKRGREEERKRGRPRPRPGTDRNCRPLSNTKGNYGTFFTGANAHLSRFEQAQTMGRFLDFTEKQ
jgi:hypothetical protein